MGYDVENSIQEVVFSDFSAGWFPGREINDIPGELFNPSSPVGMRDGNAVVWHSGGLRKMFGHDNVNTAQINSGAEGNGGYYSHVLDKHFAVFGSKLYTDVETATPTDITSAMTLSSSALVSYAEWQYESTKYAILSDGTNLILKTDGVTTSLLAGSPPT